MLIAAWLAVVAAGSAPAAELSAQAVAAIDGDTLRLADDRELRLIGIRAPKETIRADQRWAGDARALLHRLAAGQSLLLAQSGTTQDRRGRVLAQATTGSGLWLQGALLEAGLARVETFADNRARGSDMLAIEAVARQAGRGIWADPRYRVLGAAEAERIVDGYHLVEAQVVKVVERRDWFYLDFGTDWRRDFSVTVAKRDRAAFKEAGLDPAGLADARLRVRGWVRIFNGPMIDATHPEQIERLAVNRFTRLCALAAGAWTLALTLGACVIDPATGERSLGQMVTRDDELAIGREEHPRILRQFGGAYVDAALGAYVTGVGQGLARVSELPELALTFTVLNSPIVNAFALPGGYVYVTRGLLALAGSEAELASVLAHEIGHVTARHAAQRHQRVAAIAVSTKPGELGQDPAAYVQGYSREQELEADTLGIRYLARAGYDPQAMSSFLRKLDAHARLEATLMGLAGDQTDQMSFMSTHPRTAERVEAAARRAGEVAAQSSAPPQRGLNAEAYLKRIDGILYGDDPEQGFVRGTSFQHPKLLFRFDVPQGFRLFNSTQRVIARNPLEAIILFDSAKLDQTKARPGIQDYLTQTWSRELALTDVEQIVIGGLPASTGWTRVDTNRGARDLRLVAIQYDPDTIYRFTYITPPTITQSLAFDLRRSTYSFRTLTPAEAALLKPLRLQVVPVAAGDTVASLADRLPLADNRDARFRALNGLGPEDLVQAGQSVKLVVE